MRRQLQCTFFHYFISHDYECGPLKNPVIYMPGTLLHSRIPLFILISGLFTLQNENTWGFIVFPVFSRVYSTFFLFFSLHLTVWLIESFWLPGTMQRTEMWLSEHINLDHFSWDCAMSWILRNLQRNSSKTRLLSSDCFPCQWFPFADLGLFLVMLAKASLLHTLFRGEIFRVKLLGWRNHCLSAF